MVKFVQNLSLPSNDVPLNLGGTTWQTHIGHSNLGLP